MMRNRWTEEDNAKLKNLAGKARASSIAAQLGRTTAAVVMQASKLKVSLKTGRHVTRPSKKEEGQSGAGNISG